MNLLNKIIHGNCFNVLPQIPDHSVDLILADMPYNKLKIYWDKDIIDLVLLWQNYYRILTPNGIVCLFCTEPFTSRIVQSNLDWFQYKWIWKKHKSSNFMQAKKRPLNNYEEICVFYNSDSEDHIYNPIRKERSESGKNRILSAKNNNEQPQIRRSSVVSVLISKNTKKPIVTNNQLLNTELKYPELIIDDIPCVVSSSNEKTNHNTQKPVPLYEYFIKTYTKPNMIVLDNFAGSHPIVEACLNMKRNFIAIDQDQQFIDIGLTRLKTYYDKSIIIQKQTESFGNIYSYLRPFDRIIQNEIEKITQKT